MLVLVLVVAGAAWRAFGPGAGVAAAVLCAFSPNILAHGHLVTTDLGHTLLFVLAVLAPSLVLAWLAVVVVISSVSSVLPALSAARLTVREVLAYE